jgi:hypothetical protein
MKLFLFLVLLCPLISFSQTELHSQLRREDKTRIGEAIKISQFISNNIWKDWSKTQFALLLVTDSLEYLINHPNPSPDFTESYFDSYLNTKVYIRKKVFQNNFLATFPAVNGVSTIVVGTAENTKRSSLYWMITLLHEHFHQYQTNYKDYYSSVDKLDLKDGDETGMWMLNYKFPYEDSTVNNAFKELKVKLLTAYESMDKKNFKKNVVQYIKSKETFKKIVTEKDSKYFEFQLWQEGIARYTEYQILSYLIKKDYQFSDDFKSLNDYESLNDNYQKRIKRLTEEIEKVNLKDNQRNCFYSMGAIEGHILNKYKTGWRKKYFKNLFNTTSLFTKK